MAFTPINGWVRHLICDKVVHLNGHPSYSILDPDYITGYLFYDYSTTLPSGTFATPYFSSGNNKTLFMKTMSRIKIYVPYSVAINDNFTLPLRRNRTCINSDFEINTIKTERRRMKEENKFYYYYNNSVSNNDTLPGKDYLHESSLMPGFRLDWNYNSGVPIMDSFSEEKITQLYVR